MFLAQLITNDSIQSSQLVERINSYITSPIISAALIQQSAEECLSGDTEVLSHDGTWIRLDELKVGDKILALNEDLVFYCTNVTTMIHKSIEEPMYRIEGDGISQFVTKGHRVPVCYKGKLHVKAAKDLYSLYKQIGKEKLGLYKVTNIDNSLREYCGLIDVDYDITYDFTISKEEAKLDVYCPTVSGGLFVCKHNGKLSITGNCVHSDSYSVMAEDICQDTDRIYDLWMHNEELYLKNKAVADMFSVLYNGDNPTEEDLLVAFGANQVLENMVFPVGFVFFFSIENTMVGTSEMIAEISQAA